MLNKSALLARCLIGVHLLAALASLLNVLAWFYKLLCLGAIFYSLYFYLQRHYYQFRPDRIRYSKDSGWQWTDSNAQFQTIQILPSTVVSSWLIVLDFSCQRQKHSLLIMSDALATADFRALQVSLKIAGVVLCQNTTQLKN